MLNAQLFLQIRLLGHTEEAVAIMKTNKEHVLK